MRSIWPIRPFDFQVRMKFLIVQANQEALSTVFPPILLPEGKEVSVENK